MKSFKTALIQMQAGGDPEANLRRLEKGIEEAVSKEAELVCGPELFYYFGDLHKLREHATPIPGPVTEQLSRLAQRHKIHLIPGSLPELSDDGNVYNTLVIFGPDGKLIGKYRKRHLFWVDIPDVVTLDERKFLSAGENPPSVLETSLGKIGLSICYDLRFLEHYLCLARDGAEIIVAPSAFTKETGQAHWEILCRARAIETLSFVLAPNQVGHTEPAPEIYGHSLIIDPWGKILAEAGESEGVICAALDSCALLEARQRIKSID